MSRRQRGELYNPKRRYQPVSWAKLAIDNITPTDLDGLIDYHDKAFAFLELKYADAALSDGQRLAFTRIVDAIEASGRKAALFISRHWVHDCAQKVDAARTLVSEIYTRGASFCYASDRVTLRAAIDDFFELPVRCCNGPLFVWPKPINRPGQVTPIDPRVRQAKFAWDR